MLKNYVTFLFVHFSSKQLIFVYKHTLKPKRRILNAREERYLVNKIRKQPRLSAPKLRETVENTTGKTMCNQTIRRVLHKYGFHGRKVPKKDLS